LAAQRYLDALRRQCVPEGTQLRRGEVQVLAARLPDATDRAAYCLASLLSPSERSHALRFAFSRDRHRYACAHGLLRLLLTAYLECRVDDIVFGRSPYGKPYLTAMPDLHFNLSDSDGMVLIGVGAAAPLGVDIEAVRHLRSRDELARQFFCVEECRWLSMTAEQHRDAAFFRTWTAKEAVIKALGTGLSTPLDSFTVEAPADSGARGAIRGLSGSWTLLHIQPAAGYQAALVVASEDARATVRVVQLREGA
jgi:4'-phosphopantetheinyl transferase